MSRSFTVFPNLASRKAGPPVQSLQKGEPMTIVEMLVRGAALEPMFCGQGPDIRGRSNTSVIQAARAYIKATGGASSFSIEIVNERCGHAVLVSITKSAIRKRRWLADVRRYSDLDTICSECYRARIVAVETGRREAMDYLRSGKCTSLLEAVEYAVDDPDLRVALYQRVSRWRGCPVAVEPRDLAFLERRAARIIPIR
jgi:hypothetical protein